MDQGQVSAISCAAHDCDIIVPDDFVYSLVRDSEIQLRYKQLILNSFVEVRPYCFWEFLDSLTFIIYIVESPLSLEIHGLIAHRLLSLPRR